MEMHAPPAADSRVNHDDASLREDMRKLAVDAKAFASAELAYQKTRAAYASGQAKIIAMLGAGAVVLIFFSIMAAVVGTVIALGPVLSAWGAMIVVTGVLLLLAALCAMLALRHMRQMKAVLSEGNSDADIG